MKKIKILLMSAMLALTMVAVLGFGLKAHATDVKGSGATYQVTGENKVATWDFSVISITSNVNFADGDTILGILIKDAKADKAADKKVCLKATDKAFNLRNAAIFLPVPTDAVGTISFDNGSTNSGRTYGIAKYDTTTSTYVPYSAATTLDCATHKGAAAKIDFTNDMLITENNITYLPLVANASGDIKMKKFIITLTTGTFEASAQLFDIPVYDDQDVLLDTPKVTEGEALDYKPAKWGYDFAGYYTDKELTTTYDATTIITKDNVPAKLYAKFTAWDPAKIVENEITAQNIRDLLDAEFTVNEDTKLTGTIYTLQDGTILTTKNSEACIQLGKNNTNGIKIEVPANGTLTVSMTTAGTSARDVKLEAGGTDVTASALVSGTTSWTDAEAAVYTKKEITWNVSAGTYVLYGSNTVVVLSAAYTPAPAVSAKLAAQFADDATKNDLRLLGTLEGIEDLAQLTDVKFVLTLKKADGTVVAENREVAVPTLYRAITGLEGFAAAENTYYAVFVITEVQAVVTNLEGASIEASLSYTYNGEVKTVSMNNAIDLKVAA